VITPLLELDAWQVVDVGFILFAFASGKFKQQDVAALPFEAETSVLSSIALWKIYEAGVTAKEFDAVRPLGLWTFPNAAIHSREPIRTLDDFKGKKLIASNAIAAKMIPALGATPISLRPDEAYTALQRGTTDGALMPFTGMETFKLHEVTKYHLDAALAATPRCSSSAASATTRCRPRRRKRSTRIPICRLRASSARRRKSSGRNRATW
jgi:TRAP-type C4-dicarboxylate transport system substrate-binding protein